jgi:hypothetical protein
MNRVLMLLLWLRASRKTPSARVDANVPRSYVGSDDGRIHAHECNCLNLQCFADVKWQPVGESNPSCLVENQMS